MAKRKRQPRKRRSTRPIDKVHKHPRWGATKSQARRHQLERDLANAKFEVTTKNDLIERMTASLHAGTARIGELEIQLKNARPIPMVLTCPSCSARHVDVAFADKSHHTHACQHCGMCWRPAVVPTVGVKFLPGFHDDDLPVANARIP